MKTKIIAVIVLTLFTLGLSASVTANEALACCPGVGTPGYWINHPEAWPEPAAWPTGVIVIGGHEFNSVEAAIEFMDQPVKGDKYVTMFRAYAAALLNVRTTGCETDCITEDETFGPVPTLYDASGWLMQWDGQGPIAASSEAWQASHGEGLYLRLDAYNNGFLCALSRDVVEEMVDD